MKMQQKSLRCINLSLNIVFTHLKKEERNISRGSWEFFPWIHC